MKKRSSKYAKFYNEHSMKIWHKIMDTLLLISPVKTWNCVCECTPRSVPLKTDPPAVFFKIPVPAFSGLNKFDIYYRIQQDLNSQQILLNIVR